MKQFFKFFIVFLFFFSTNLSQTSDKNLNEKEQQLQDTFKKFAYCNYYFQIKDYLNVILKLLKDPMININKITFGEAQQTCLMKPFSFIAKDLEPEEQIAITKALIKAGININAQDKFGNTALMYMALRPNIAQCLLDAGADSTIKNNSRKTVFDYYPHLKILNQHKNNAHKERDTALCNMKLINPAQPNQPYRCNAMILERTLQLLGTPNYPAE